MIAASNVIDMATYLTEYFLALPLPHTKQKQPENR